MNYLARVFAIGFILVSVAAAQEKETVPVAIIAHPDLILYNAKVVSMDDTAIGSSLPGHVFQAVAIRDRKIQALGADAEILSYAGPKTQKIDLRGRTVIPGIVDPHTHIHNNEVNWWIDQHPELFDAVGKRFTVGGTSYEELKKGIEIVLKENMPGHPPGYWAYISLPTNDPKNPGSGTGIGVNYLQNRLNDEFLKTLDALAPDYPVFLRAHPAKIINTAAKKAIEKLYGFFPTEHIVDESGFGALAEYERALFVDEYFRTRPRELADITEVGLRKYAAMGITTYSSHMMGLQFFPAFQVLIREDRMPIRFAYTIYYGFQGNPDPAAFYLRLGDMAGLGTPYFWSAGTGLGSVDAGPPMFCSTMEAPKDIKDREFCRNIPGGPIDKATLTAILHKHRVAVGHSYGDKSVDYVMDAVEEAMKLDPSITLEYVRSRRFSSDHCGFYPRPAQIPRMARLGWWISCGGNVLSRSYPWLKIYGLKQYANWIAPINSLLKAGVKTVYETETGVNGNTANTYWKDGYALITRKNDYGDLVAPEEAVDRMTLMKMSTSWPAEFALGEKNVGTLEPGKFADLVVLNKDYFTVPEAEIRELYPLMTMVGGKIIVLRSEFATELGMAPIGPQLEFKNDRNYAGGE